MKFSVISRNAKPTASPTTPARPRIESTAWVSFRADSASSRPPMISIELIREPTTDRNSTLCTNGASRVSEWAAKRRARTAEIAANPSATSTRSHFRAK